MQSICAASKRALHAAQLTQTRSNGANEAPSATIAMEFLFLSLSLSITVQLPSRPSNGSTAMTSHPPSSFHGHRFHLLSSPTLKNTSTHTQTLAKSELSSLPTMGTTAQSSSTTPLKSAGATSAGIQTWMQLISPRCCEVIPMWPFRDCVLGQWVS